MNGSTGGVTVGGATTGTGPIKMPEEFGRRIYHETFQRSMCGAHSRMLDECRRRPDLAPIVQRVPAAVPAGH